MMVVFEVHLVPGADPSNLLTAETQRDTQAQVMTFAEAKKVGFGGMGEPPADHEVRLIAVAKRDERRIYQVLEASEAVGGFRKHEID